VSGGTPGAQRTIHWSLEGFGEFDIGLLFAEMIVSKSPGHARWPSQADRTFQDAPGPMKNSMKNTLRSRIGARFDDDTPQIHLLTRR
jgi:hypothetical protein